MDSEALVSELGLRALTGSTGTIFDRFQELIESYTLPGQIKTISDIKQLTKTMKGTIFETFSKMYLLRIYGCQTVSLLKELPLETKNYFGLPTNDFGIDLIATWNQEVYAVQCKWRNSRSPVISWRELSTFYTLCARTGILRLNGQRSWDRHIVMTNCPSVARVTERQQTDFNICLGTFQGLSAGQWIILLNIPSYRVGTSSEIPLTREDLRSARLRALANLEGKKSPEESPSPSPNIPKEPTVEEQDLVQSSI